MSQSALPKGSLILVTGVNGYIASHCANEALAAGFRIRGTVRSLAKADRLLEIFDRRYGKGHFEPVVVTDMSAKGAFDTVMKDCAAVIHCASVTSFDPDPDKVIPPTVDGALEVLRSASRNSSVKRVVYTSSSSTLTFDVPGPSRHITQDTWNNDAVEWAKTKPTGRGYPMMGMIMMAASKVLAEKACWDFVKTKEPHFVFNTVVPTMNTGEILDLSQASSTGGMIKAAWDGDKASSEVLKSIGAVPYIDVKDDARLHLAALMFDDVRNERLLAAVEPVSFNVIRDTFAQIDPTHPLPDRDTLDPQDTNTYDTVRSLQLIRRLGRPGWETLLQSIKENVSPADIVDTARAP